MKQRIRSIWLLPLAVALTSCSGGSSDSGAGSAGVTPFTGNWYVVATLNVNVGGTPTSFTDTTQFVVGASGNAVITNTDSQCGLKIFLNGYILTYEASCVFSATSAASSGTTTTSATAPCVLTIRTMAGIRGPQGKAVVSGSFGPKTEVCSGAAVSYTGNLVGAEGTPPSSTGTGTSGTGTGTGTTTGTGTGTSG